MLNAKDNQKSITGHKKQSPLLPSTITTLLFFHAFLLSYYYHPIQCSSCSVMETKKIGGPEKNTILYFAPAEQATKLGTAFQRPPAIWDGTITSRGLMCCYFTYLCYSAFKSKVRSSIITDFLPAACGMVMGWVGVLLSCLGTFSSRSNFLNFQGLQSF